MKHNNFYSMELLTLDSNVIRPYPGQKCYYAGRNCNYMLSAKQSHNYSNSHILNPIIILIPTY